jgi:multidrug efflux pump subunit AcrA (membrane-fusion protein)
MKDSSTDLPLRRRNRRLAGLAFPALILAAGALTSVAPGVVQQDAPATRLYRELAPGVVPGTTAPSKEMDLAFADYGRVAEVTVKEGDRVEAGQLLMRQDLAADEALLRSLQVKADVAARVEVARTQLELAKVELEAIRAASTAASDLEVQRAELEVKAAETRILEEERQGRFAAHDVEQQQARVDQRSMFAPDAGVVQKLDAAVGEVFGPQTPALKVVKIDPLYVEVVEVPATQVMRMKVGDTVQVRYGEEDEWQDARIVFINPVGDPYGDSSRLAFRAELPNPDGVPAGLAVQVRLGGNQATAGGAGQ